MPPTSKRTPTASTNRLLRGGRRPLGTDWIKEIKMSYFYWIMGLGFAVLLAKVVEINLARRED